MSSEADRVALDAAFATILAARDRWQRRSELLAGPDGQVTFLRHVIANVRSYRELATLSVDPAHPRLEQFPVLTRTIVASDRLGFLSSIAETAHAPLFAKTSGSTGKPLTVRFGQTEWYELTQASYGRIARNIPEINKHIRPGELSVALILEGANRQEAHMLLFELGCSMFSRFVLRGSQQNDAEVVRTLRATVVPILYGKPVYLLRLAELDAKMGRPGSIRPASILVSGENLYRDQRRELEAWYGCRVVNAYTSVEGGLIGLQCPIGNGLHVDASRITLEILRTDGVLTADGEGEIVTTNLWNWTMPFVRYRTGDFGLVHLEPCACGHRGPTIARLDGREVGAFESASGRVNTEAFDDLFSDLNIEHFQIEQFSRDSFELRWASRDCGAADQEQVMIKRLQAHVGNAALKVCRLDSFTKRGFKARRYFSKLVSPEAGRPAKLTATELRPRQAFWRPLALDPDARAAAFASPDSVELLELGPDARTRCLNLRGVTCGCFSPADDVFACASSAGDVVLKILGGRPRTLMQARSANGAISSLSFSYDGEILVAGGSNGTLQSWVVGQAECASISQAHKSAISAIASSSVARLVASAGRAERATGIQVRKLPDLELLSEIPMTIGVHSLAFMIDENILAAGLEDGSVEIWNADSVTRIATFQHSGAVTAVVFVPAAQAVAAGSDKGAIKLWHVWRSNELASFHAHAGAVGAIAVLPEGNGFVSLGEDAAVMLWPL